MISLPSIRVDTSFYSIENDNENITPNHYGSQIDRNLSVSYYSDTSSAESFISTVESDSESEHSSIDSLTSNPLSPDFNCRTRRFSTSRRFSSFYTEKTVLPYICKCKIHQMNRIDFDTDSLLNILVSQNYCQDLNVICKMLKQSLGKDIINITHKKLQGYIYKIRKGNRSYYKGILIRKNANSSSETKGWRESSHTSTPTPTKGARFRIVRWSKGGKRTKNLVLKPIKNLDKFEKNK